ncbi:MAG TPA: GGDEF domain-containing protein [Actinomycetota bacterium]|nr:GGDEF domain-containing protein [Actinomycetota bacterium]
MPGVLVAYATAFGMWFAFGWGGEAMRAPVAELALLPVGIVGVALAARAALRDAAMRRAWMLIGAALGSMLAGDAIRAVIDLTMSRDTFPSVADLFTLSFYPLVMAGLVSMPMSQRRAGDALKIGLDSLTILIGGGMLVWHFVMRPFAVRRGGLEGALALTYPAADLVLLFGIAAVLFRRPDGAARWTLKILASACALLVGADLAYGALSLRGVSGAGAWPDGLRMGAQALFAIAACLPQESLRRRRPAEDTHHVKRAFSMLPYASVAMAYGLLIVVARPVASDPAGFLLIGAIALTAVVTARQITVMFENERLTRRLERLVRLDELTGLFTRRAFMDLAQREWARAHRYSRPLSALAIDVDRFKEINDTYGHATGDEVLAAVARRCRLSLRVTDVLGRLGGDEFVAVLSDTTTRDARALVERLRGLMSLPVETGHGVIEVTVSIGLADANGSPNLRAMMDRADAALYQAKQSGRDCVREAAVAS